MNAILTGVDAWITALVLAAMMVAGWALGRWSGRRLTATGETELSKFGDAILALLGLLLGFTFAMALGKHDQRRLMLVADSNAIGDFYTCASLVKGPARGKLQKTIRSYVEHRLTLADTPFDVAKLQNELNAVRAMHNQMQELVEEAVDGGTPVTIPLVNTLNEVTSSHASQLAAVRDRLPPSIIVVLSLAAVLSMSIVGRQQGAAQERHYGTTLAFVALVSMVVWVILDLNQPQRGLITVSHEPLLQLLSGMAPSR